MLIEKSYPNFNSDAQSKPASRIQNYHFDRIQNNKPIQLKQVAK